MVGRKSHPVYEQLSPIEGAKAGWLRIAKANYAQQLVFHRVSDRDGVGELLCRVDTIVVADWDIGRRSAAGHLPREAR